MIVDPEAALLGSLLLDNSPASEVREIVRATHFRDLRHRTIFEAIGKMLDAGTAVDVTTLKARLEAEGTLRTAGTEVYLGELLDACPNPANAVHYAKAVQEQAGRRRKKTAAERLAKAAETGRNDPEANAEMRAALAEEEKAKADGRLKPIRAVDLLRMNLPEPRWAVPGLLPVGVSLLVGRPKIGKSWAALNLAVAVAAGGRAFGSIQVEKGEVLYLALEDTYRRFQDRLKRVIQGGPCPDGLHVGREWPKLDHGGADRIAAWIREHSGARLIVVDTLECFRGRREHNANAYGEDYKTMAVLKAVADTHNVALVLLHHDRKAEATDVYDSVNGSLGLNGGADGLLLLKRGRGENSATLHVTGRDVEEAELALRWDPRSCSWSVEGDAADVRMSPARRAVVAALRKTGGPMSPKELAKTLGKGREAVRSLLLDMAATGEVVSLGGAYTLPKEHGNTGNRGTDTPVAPVPGVPSVPPVSSVPPVGVCKGYPGVHRRGWRIDGGEVRCGTCHPPAPGLAVEWIESEDAA